MIVVFHVHSTDGTDARTMPLSLMQILPSEIFVMIDQPGEKDIFDRNFGPAKGV